MQYFFLFIFLLCSLFASAEEGELTKEISQDNLDGYSESNEAEVIIINKVTSKSYKKTLNIEEPEYFGTLAISLDKCVTVKTENKEKDLMLITVTDLVNNKVKLVFSGWLFPQNIAINSFEHPIFEIIPIKCRAVATKQ